MGKSKDLSDFDKGQIVMARRLDQSISETARLVGCSRSAVVNIHRQWSEKGQTTNRRQGVGRPRLIDAQGQRMLSLLVPTDRRCTVAQVTEIFNDGYGRNVSQHTVHRTLLRMGLRRRAVSAEEKQPNEKPAKLKENEKDIVGVEVGGGAAEAPAKPDKVNDKDDDEEEDVDEEEEEDDK